MVTVFAIGGLVAPAGRLATVMTALASGIVAGTALGSSLGGQFAQEGGHHAAFLVPVSRRGSAVRSRGGGRRRRPFPEAAAAQAS